MASCPMHWHGPAGNRTRWLRWTKPWRCRLVPELAGWTPNCTDAKLNCCITGSDRDATAAEGQFRKAIDIACRQSAKLFELRAGIGLARLLCGQGRGAEAHALLAPIYSWFTEGFNTPDLTEARELLTEVAGTSAQPYVINPTGDGG